MNHEPQAKLQLLPQHYFVPYGQPTEEVIQVAASLAMYHQHLVLAAELQLVAARMRWLRLYNGLVNALILTAGVALTIWCVL